jgi:hypothetical protein
MIEEADKNARVYLLQKFEKFHGPKCDITEI